MQDRPDTAAVRDPVNDVTISYAELWTRAGWQATELVRRGVRPGDVVAVELDRSVDLVVALLGVLRTGAAYLPLDRQAPAERTSGILAEAGVQVVIRPGDLPAGAPLGEPPDSAAGGDDPCYAMYTSGSTGRPKGVLIPHRAVVRLVTRSHYCVVAPGDHCANGANPAFDATTFEIWGALAAGATVVVFPSVLDLTIDAWTALVRRERIDTMFLTTSLFHTVAREQPGAFGALGNLVIGGEQLDLAAVRGVLAAGGPRRLVNGYGPTETTTFAAYFDCTSAALTGVDRIPIGFPIQDTTLCLFDDAMRPVPPGEIGELCVGGPGVALGYLGRPELTEERFVADPDTGARLYRTGDVGRQLPSGAIEVLDRRDRQVKLRGFRIELEEIEQAAVTTGLCAAAVVEKVGEGASAYLAGFVLPATPVRDDLVAALTARLTERLPAYMVPGRWWVVDELPLGAAGKLDRARLLELVAAPADPDGGPDAGDDTLGSVGEALREIWQDVLNVPHAAHDDSFLDLGGNSVMAVQVAIRILHRFALEVEPAEVLLADSLAELADVLRDAVPATS